MSELITPNAAEFCNILAAARNLKLPGSWSGSSYGHHPCGVIRRNMLFVNHWNTNDYCDVFVHTMNPVEFCPWDKDPGVHGDPIPHPKEGSQISVYWSGTWRDDGPWRQAIIDVLGELRAEIEAARKVQSEKDTAQRIAAQEAHAALIAKAANSFTGAS